MDTKNMRKITLAKIPSLAIAGAAALLILSSVAALADGPYSMAPPVQPQYQGGDYSAPDDSGNASQDSVFNWNDVPENQQVPITRAVFDQGGYQLYDSVGETIIVPFNDNNLYVMKFAVSPDDSMFFVNDGDAPVLYVPRDGYLENATVDGARWYPFSDDFHPATPVFVGCAPSWTAFVAMGWYPGMVCHGGFYCDVSFWDGGVFVPCVGLDFIIGGHSCYGWHDYDDYCYGHPGWHPIGFYHRDVYGWANQPHPFGHPFAGGHPWNGGHAMSGGSHNWGSANGGTRGWNQNGHNWNTSDRSWGNSDTTHHAFQGAQGGGNWNNRWSGNHNSGSFSGSGHPSFQGTDHNFSNGDHSFNGDHNFSGGDHSGVSQDSGSGRAFRGGQGGGGQFGSGDRSFGGGNSSFGGQDHSFSGGHSFGGQNDAGPAHAFAGGSSSWQNRSFGGGDHQSYSGGGHSFGGSDHPSFNGGGHSSSGGDSGHSQDSHGGGNSSNSNSGHWGH